MDSRLLAWLAGFLDARGNISGRRYPTRYSPVIRCSVRDRDINARVYDLFHPMHHGVTATSGRPFRVQLSLTGRNAAGLLFILYPMLSNRRKQQIEDLFELVQKLGPFGDDWRAFTVANVRAQSSTPIDFREPEKQAS